MRHHAWLTVPPKAEKDQAAQRARIESLEDDSPWRGYPSIGDADGLLEWLAQAGWCAWGDYGARGLTWPEWDAWQRLTGAPVHGWRVQWLFALSHHYAGAANAAREPGALSDWEPETVPSEALMRAQRSRIKAALRGGSV